jgi:hypothetical protein
MACYLRAGRFERLAGPVLSGNPNEVLDGSAAIPGMWTTCCRIGYNYLEGVVSRSG